MTHHDIFDSLTRNAFDFLERGIAEFDKTPKYSVIHFCAAVEMLLKARLMKEQRGRRIAVLAPLVAGLRAGDQVEVAPLVGGAPRGRSAGGRLRGAGQEQGRHDRVRETTCLRLLVQLGLVVARDVWGRRGGGAGVRAPMRSERLRRLAFPGLCMSPHL